MKKARKKNEKDDLFFNEIFSNPIHGEYNKEKQLEIIVHNNIILYDYISSLWENFKNYFR